MIADKLPEYNAKLMDVYNHWLSNSEMKCPEFLLKRRAESVNSLKHPEGSRHTIEKWRFTSLADYFETGLTPIDTRNNKLTTISDAEAGIVESFLKDKNSIPVIFMNGTLVKSDDFSLNPVPGLKLSSIRQSSVLTYGDISAIMEATPFDPEEPFLNLNTAMVEQGVCLEFTQDFDPARPVHLVNFYTDAATSAIVPVRNIVAVRHGANAALMETVMCAGDIALTDNTVNHILLEQQARLDHVRCCRVPEKTYVFHYTGVSLAKESSYRNVMVNSGGAISRNNLSIVLNEPDADVVSGGFYGIDATQQAENYTRIHHRVSNTHSRQLYNGILAGTSRGIFRGCINVDRYVKQADAFQLNKNILLEKTARVNSMPWLEIDSGEISCEHGSATGMLNTDQLFYMISRGIDRNKAERMLLGAYADEVIALLDNETLRHCTREVTEGIIDTILKRINQ